MVEFCTEEARAAKLSEKEYNHSNCKITNQSKTIQHVCRYVKNLCNCNSINGTAYGCSTVHSREFCDIVYISENQRQQAGCQKAARQPYCCFFHSHFPMLLIMLLATLRPLAEAC